MTTLEDVAKRAGVSTATVSKVLSNTPYFTEETRAKVMDAVDELGYVPHLAARALSSGKTRIIAVVFPYIYDTIFTDPLVMSILQGIEAECSRQGYNMLLSMPRLSTNEIDENYRQLVRSGYMDGVIGLDAHPLVSALTPFYERGIPGVSIGYHHNDFNVRSADRSGGYELMKHLLDLGHREIGIISVPPGMHRSIDQRIVGIRAAAETVNIDIKLLPRLDGDFSMESGAACAAELLEAHPELTAILCINDRMAMGAIQQARLMGRHIPNNLSVVGYDNIPMVSVFAPPLTTVDQLAPDMGQTAALMLFDVLRGARPGSVEMPTKLIIRQSAAIPPV